MLVAPVSRATITATNASRGRSLVWMIEMPPRRTSSDQADDR